MQQLYRKLSIAISLLTFNNIFDYKRGMGKRRISEFLFIFMMKVHNLIINLWININSIKPIVFIGGDNFLLCFSFFVPRLKHQDCPESRLPISIAFQVLYPNFIHCFVGKNVTTLNAFFRK